MRMNRCKALLQLCVYLSLPLGHADCPYKECVCTEADILCSSINLQSIPQLVSSSTRPGWDLVIDGNNISEIPSGSLPWNLTDIDMDGNPVTTIDDDAFKGSVHTLLTMYLSTVRFTKFPDAFGHLRALIELSITGGNITDWNEDVWKILGPTLETLSLENVGITTWPMWIKYCTKLIDLTIAYATFSTIPDNALDNLANSLTRLNLYNNRLTMVPKAISILKSLQMLNIPENHITDVTWLPHNSKLTTLTLNNNYISNASHLSQALLPFNGSLNSLDTTYNLLTSVPDLSFLMHVQSFDFSHNRIFDSQSGNVNPNTFTLMLSFNSLTLIPSFMSTLLSLSDYILLYNNIKCVHETDFHSSVTTIDLGYNLVTQLTDDSFPDNFGLLYLYLNNNPLTTLSPVALQRLPHLRGLNLQQTQLTRLPLALSYLSDVVTVDVSNCTALVCTCTESGLATWVMKLMPESVLGNCGHTSVFDFFSMLSPDCPTNIPANDI